MDRYGTARAVLKVLRGVCVLAVVVLTLAAADAALRLEPDILSLAILVSYLAGIASTLLLFVTVEATRALFDIADDIRETRTR